MTARDKARRKHGTTTMTNRTVHFLLALLATAAIASQAQAGMSGTSERLQQQGITQAQAAPPQPRQQVQQRRSVVRPDRAVPPSGGNFDGIWAVASSPGCGLVARSAGYAAVFVGMASTAASMPQAMSAPSATAAGCP